MASPANSEPMIEAVQLSKFYGIFAATRDVSFTVNRGEVVRLLRVHYIGSQKLGYLPEKGPLYPDMTPYSLLDFFGEARGMGKKLKKDRIASAVELCSLESVIYKPISKLSKGYRQRVGMAQALLHEPEVLIMDEPTSGLDPNQIRGVRKAIRRLGETKTILLSTHILQEVKAMASRVVMINEGRLVYDGPLSEMDPRNKGLDEVFADLTGHGENPDAPESDEESDGLSGSRKVSSDGTVADRPTEANPQGTSEDPGGR